MNYLLSTLRLVTLCSAAGAVGADRASGVEPTSGVRETVPLRLSAHPQLFLDDHLIARRDNLRRVLQRPARHAANPLIVQDQPWEKRSIALYGTVLFDEMAGKYRCWYLATETDSGVPDTPEAPGTAEYYQCYAESSDGIHWLKPTVGERPYGRHTKHNIVVPEAHGLGVLHRPDAADSRRRYVGIGGATLAFSPDGIHWDIQSAARENWRRAVKKNDTSSCLIHWKGEYLADVRYQGEERSVVDRQRGLKWRGVMRQVGISVSDDLDRWTSKRMVFRTDREDGSPWTQPYGICVTPYGDVLIGLLPVLHLTPRADNNSDGLLDIQLVVSRDGRTWKRVAGRAVFMTHGEVGAKGGRPWDLQVYPSTTMLIRNDTVTIYYTGSNTRHGEARRAAAQGIQPRRAIGLATLPADRFVAVVPAAAGRPGTLQTRPFTASGRRLLVNVRIDSGSDLRVEVLDEEGAVMPHLGNSACRLIRHDARRYHVTWTGDDGVTRSWKDVAGDRPHALRLTLRGRTELFAFSLAQK